ncbi:AraC-type DNA-binding protein [Mucilaginibacter gossypiicola]|uniref:AraC-type DNA-binding protein n=1 Tax=Mucilaginibacter gossypiicola TaxID=551995 RepID=A0A1H8NS82_9SPHI|nr:helix-turn-helix transcriptional regulator [Mucilaginibacter gossypiicola]SEO32188.1 AraC-type DNA-binding protein [Mucilaginibacter gossypiicola]
MKITIRDKGAGIVQEFAKAIGAEVKGRYTYIPESKGGGYITGFSWGSDMRMMIRNYHLNEDLIIERTNDLVQGQEDMVFLLSGVLPLAQKELSAENAYVLICKHAVSSLMDMPSHTLFGSITIAVSMEYLRKIFGHLEHPIAASVLHAGEHFVLETTISAGMITAAADLLNIPVPEVLESQYSKLKCEELLHHIFALLIQREAVPLTNIHIKDIKAVYRVKAQLQNLSGNPPDVAGLAAAAGMSAPKLRKLFRQTFGKGVFEYYQSARMQEAARLLREKHLAVSEVGYQLGFTNLSYFSRIFEQYIGMKPKKYAVTFQLNASTR